MKVIIAGGRDVGNYRADMLVSAALARSGWEITEIIHGGASGIDAAAGRLTDWEVTVVRADWIKHGKAAGPIRNREMATMADALIAVWDGKSRGTKNMIETAERMGLKVYVHRYTLD